MERGHSFMNKYCIIQDYQTVVIIITTVLVAIHKAPAWISVYSKVSVLTLKPGHHEPL